MPRAPNVTRTITATRCTVRCYHPQRRIFYGRIVWLPRVNLDHTKALNKIRALYENPKEQIIVSLDKMEVVSDFYSLPETKFIEVCLKEDNHGKNRR